ncbi:RNA polymerase sigma factor [Fimbriiglobus ruber]|uniref:Uncharacterized protein n=1 Tax=Fimbriiglobus ruber TaxID=1908690 RepID=A0A225DHM0_9BACT|nr:sigma-70 family RNA polymerase sigma factor [Fimbriiglobus ruber]OWK40990.1 hypothetical protein FRUB_04882 [Fimbriiglobus ruber]
MTTDEFRAWFLASCESLLAATFRCVQTTCGGRYEDAEDGVQIALSALLREAFLDRIYPDATDRPRVRYRDGRPGALLFSYFVRVACRGGCRHRDDEPTDPDDVADATADERPGGLRGLIRDESTDAFRGCWRGLTPEQRGAIAKSLCEGEPLDGTDRQRKFRGMTILRHCLVGQNWHAADLIDIQTQMLDVICGSPEPTGGPERKGR